MNSYIPPRPRPPVSSSDTASINHHHHRQSDHQTMPFKRFWSFRSSSKKHPEEKSSSSPSPNPPSHSSSPAPPPPATATATAEARRPAPYIPRHAASDFLQISAPPSPAVSRAPSRRSSKCDRSVSTRSGSTRSSLQQRYPMDYTRPDFAGPSLAEEAEYQEGDDGDYMMFLKEADEEHAGDVARRRDAFHARLQRTTISEGRKGGRLREYVKPTSVLY